MYHVKEEEIYAVHEDVQQQLIVTGAKLMRSDNHNRQLLQYCLLESNQRNLFEELEGKWLEVFDPEPEGSRIFWGENVEWFGALETDVIGLKQQENLGIIGDKKLHQRKRVPNWKSSWSDGVHRFWIKKSQIKSDKISEHC